MCHRVSRVGVCPAKMNFLGDNTRKPRVEGDSVLNAQRLSRRAAPSPKKVQPKDDVGESKSKEEEKP
jgi:hypothetical protein